VVIATAAIARSHWAGQSHTAACKRPGWFASSHGDPGAKGRRRRTKCETDRPATKSAIDTAVNDRAFIREANAQYVVTQCVWQKSLTVVVPGEVLERRAASLKSTITSAHAQQINSQQKDGTTNLVKDILFHKTVCLLWNKRKTNKVARADDAV